MKILEIIFVVLALIFSVSTSQATLTIHYWGDVDNVQKNVIIQWYSSSAINVYAGWYQFSIDNGPRFNSYCIDPFTTTSPGQWQANSYTPFQVSTGSGKLYSYDRGNGTKIYAQGKYNMIGYLYNTYGYTLATPSARAILNLAFWEIAYDYNGLSNSLNLAADGFQATNATDRTAANIYLTEAWNFMNNGGNSYPYLLTPDPVTAGQEIPYIPEPGTFLLLGSGLIGFSILSRFRRKKA